jgi:putative membrane protein
MANAIAAYLHYLSIFVLFALLTMEHVQFKLPMDLPRARSLYITDIAFGITAGVVLATGLLRVFWQGKGLEFYLKNGFFHAKVSLFILIALLSILPTFTILNWRNALKAGQVPEISASKGRLVIMFIRLELLLLLMMPLMAVFMARGFGMGS